MSCHELVAYVFGMLSGAILVGVRPWWLAVIGVAVSNLIGAVAVWLAGETEHGLGR